METKHNRSGYIHAMAIASWILAYLLTGRLVWHWMAPVGLGGVMAFIPLWLLFGYFAQTSLFLIVTLVARTMKPDVK